MAKAALQEGNMGGSLINSHTELSTRLFKVREDKLPVFFSEMERLDFLRSHPHNECPKLWKEDKSGRRVVRDKKVTDVFVNEIVDTLISSVAAFSLYKYHHSGINTGDVVENQTDTALTTPKEDARVVGTQLEGTSTFIYKSVATITYTGSWGIKEHGLFNTAGAGGPPVVGGSLMDRTVFAVINVVTGNQIEFTFTISFTAGG